MRCAATVTIAALGSAWFCKEVSLRLDLDSAATLHRKRYTFFTDSGIIPSTRLTEKTHVN
jgi:hypothetical protein